jgi:dienelactone hydrolase
MTERQQIVTFPNRDGLTLVGVVHEPVSAGRRDVAVILLSPGVKMRVAPQRLYVRLAEMLTSIGFTVLRFDFYGLGDSEGTINEPLLKDLYGSIQVGRYIGDTRDAIEWMQRTYGFRRVIVGGLCGGAITGLLAAAEDPAVCGVLGYGVPVMLDSSTIDPRKYMTAGQLSSIRAKYLAKLRNPSAWLRILTFKTDFRLLWKALRKSARPKPAAAAASAPPVDDNSNPCFPRALFKVLGRSTPVLLLFSGADRLYAEFNEKFLTRHGEQFDAHAAQVDVRVVDSANHVFTFREWQDDMLRQTELWLNGRFGDSAGPVRQPPAEALAS